MRMEVLLSIAILVPSIQAAEVPKSPYIAFVYRYGDAMLEHGRDAGGPEKKGLFHGALDRKTFAPLAGPDPLKDENLLRLLSALSDLSSKPHYREAADVELRWSMEHFSSSPARAEPARPWVLWERCFEIAPEPSLRAALAYLETGAGAAATSPRRAGFLIRAAAAAHRSTKDGKFLRTIEDLLDGLEKEMDPRTGFIGGKAGDGKIDPAECLSLAIDCDAASAGVGEPLASRLRVLAGREDGFFMGLSHDITAKGGFFARIERASGKPTGEITPLWEAREGSPTTAQVAMMCVSRYDNTGRSGFRGLLLRAADLYLKSLPGGDADAWPMTFGHAVSLEIAAWRHTARQAYFDGARRLGDLALEKFWDGGSPLPRASFKAERYESATGAATLALALYELHLQVLHITAVRYPANTIDR